MNNYKIYPSLLDKFQDYLDYHIIAEQPWNKVSESALSRGLYEGKEAGDYILSPDEMAERLEVELINQINRCLKEPNEAADAGTAFNEVVDCLIHKKNTDRQDIKLKTLRRQDGSPVCIEAKMNGFTFNFDIDLCRELAEYYRGAISQYLVQADLQTMHGNVLLYGYIDEWVGSKIYDIKTTSMYDFGKFERKTQRLVYPYCAIESGLTRNIDSFEYTIVKWSRRKDIIYKTRMFSTGGDNLDDYEKIVPEGVEILNGEIFKEEYSYNHPNDTERLRLFVERFIEWLEYRKDYITDKKIFGGENPEGYIGTQITNL